MSEIGGAYFQEGLFLGGLLSEFYGMLLVTSRLVCILLQ